MKKFLAIALIATSFVACNGGETKTETPATDSVVAPVAVDSVVAPVDSVVAPVAVDSAK
jgi:hypothetical protein